MKIPLMIINRIPTHLIPGIDPFGELFYTIERFHHAGGLAKPLARLAVIITETKTKSFYILSFKVKSTIKQEEIKNAAQ